MIDTFRRMKRIIESTFLFVLISGFLFAPFSYVAAAESEELSVTPVILNEKAKERDIIKQSITVSNTSNRKLNLYPSVYDVSPIEGETGFVKAGDSTERAVSLANWVELSRGVIELGPGEEKVIPFVIRVNLSAAPGMYHAHISFAEGSTRESAEASEPLSVVTVNVEVEKDIKEVMQLASFKTDNFFLSGDDVIFNYQVENIGNQELQPRGEVRIYDRSGKEVASVPVNKDGAVFSPEQKAQLASVWGGAQGFGKYKAFLNIDYGSTQTASVQDTVFFWIVPWKELSLFFVMGILLIGGGVFYFHRRHEKNLGYHTMHTSPFAHVAAMPSVMPQAPKPLFPFSFPKKQQAMQPEIPPAPAPVAQVPHVVPAAVAPRRTHSTILEVSVPTRPSHQGNTINLKDLPMRHTASHQTNEGHVINLKK